MDEEEGEGIEGGVGLLFAVEHAGVLLEDGRELGQVLDFLDVDYYLLWDCDDSLSCRTCTLKASILSAQLTPIYSLGPKAVG